MPKGRGFTAPLNKRVNKIPNTLAFLVAANKNPVVEAVAVIAYFFCTHSPTLSHITHSYPPRESHQYGHIQD